MSENIEVQEETNIIDLNEYKKVNEEVKEVAFDEACIFINESAKFDVIVRFNNTKDKGLVVEGVDDSFEEDGCESFSLSFKVPSQGDVELISRTSKLSISNDDISLQDFALTEFARVMVLIRGWSLKKKVNQENLLSLHPRIARAIAAKVREEIGMDGII